MLNSANFRKNYPVGSPTSNTLFDLAGKEQEIAILEKQMESPTLWDDQEHAQKVTQRLAMLRGRVESFQRMSQCFEDAAVLLGLGEDEDDHETALEVQTELRAIENWVAELELELLLSGPYDDRNAILAMHAGAGGLEAQDWVEMLFRMFTRWAERRGFRYETLDLLAGDEAGIKSVTFQVSGPMAYGYLRSEKGVHRLVRISPFDTGGRRHTSFASVDVMPVVDEDAEVEINPDDLRIDTFRSGGAGGQHVNKTDSAVRITHLPSSTVVSCQNERSQLSNRNAAMKMLKSKLLAAEIKRREEELAVVRGSQKDIAWGSQIRSYVFQPYTMVKDHRTKYEKGNVSAVMDGEIDEFIQAYLIWQARGHQKEN
jgi:peptide chain release factor 2